jgi:hypothetical protein
MYLTKLAFMRWHVHDKCTDFSETESFSSHLKTPETREEKLVAD